VNETHRVYVAAAIEYIEHTVYQYYIFIVALALKLPPLYVVRAIEGYLVDVPILIALGEQALVFCIVGKPGYLFELFGKLDNLAFMQIVVRRILVSYTRTARQHQQ
jgi:hypothetical protein